jgi:hypothetical protein
MLSGRRGITIRTGGSMKFRPGLAFMAFLIFFSTLSVMAFPASAYFVTLNAPDQVASGMPLLVNGSTTLFPGTPVSVVITQANAAGSERARKDTVIDDQKLFSASFDTSSLGPGQYKVELRLDPANQGKIGTGSTTYHLVTVTEWAPEIDITSAKTIHAGEDLVVSGTIRHLEGEGLQVRIIGPSGILFGPQYVPLNKDQEKKSARFSVRVKTDVSGNYYAEFFDGRRPIGSIPFTAAPAEVISPVQQVPSIPVSLARESTPEPEVTTKAPFQPASFIPGFILLLLVMGRRGSV